MAFAKRIVLFMVTNILIVMTIGFVVKLTGIEQMLGPQYGPLIVLSLVWGFGGALASLALSRIIAKWSMGVKVIDPKTQDPRLRELLQTVHRLSRSAGLSKMPEVGVYDSPELNAFATGPTRSRALVAVSSGLLQSMDQRSLEGVLGHEIAHVANGDMVTMTLLQGLVNAFAIFLARIVAGIISNALRGDREDSRGGLGGFAYFGVVMLLEWVFLLLGMVVVAAFSRYREYRADAGGSRLAGRENMISALQVLQIAQKRGIVDESETGKNQTVAALKISSNRRSRLAGLFSTHPPLEERIARLKRA